MVWLCSKAETFCLVLLWNAASESVTRSSRVCPSMLGSTLTQNGIVKMFFFSVLDKVYYDLHQV